jgi:hypothetical protein
VELFVMHGGLDCEGHAYVGLGRAPASSARMGSDSIPTE